MADYITTWILELKEKITGPFKVIKRDVDTAESGVEDLNKDLKDTTDVLEDIKGVAASAFAAFGLNEIYTASEDLANLTNRIMILADVSEDVAGNIGKDIMSIADTYDVHWNEVLLSANALTKQLGGSLQENLGYIQQGFEKGADFSGDFLNQLKEYPAQFKDAGLGAKELIGLIAQASQEGVWSDKAPDTIKEMSLSIREMTQIQRDAIAGLGMDADQLLEDMNTGAKSPYEAMQVILSAMKDIDVQARQTAIADIFKGAGEDLGQDFLLALADMDLNIENIEASGYDANTSFKQFKATISEIKTDFVDLFLPAIAWFNDLIAENKTLVTAVVAVLGSMAAALAVVQAVTWGWAIAMQATGIPLIVAGIAGLVGLLALLYMKVEPVKEAFNDVGEIFSDVWSSIKELGGSVMELFSVFSSGEADATSAFWDYFAMGIRWVFAPIKALAALVSWFVDGLSVGAEMITSYFKENKESIMGFAEDLYAGFQEVVSFVVDAIKWLANMVLEYHPLALLAKGLFYLFPSLKQEFLKIYQWIYENIIEPLTGWFKELFDWIKGGDHKVKVELDDKGNPKTDNPFGGDTSGGGISSMFDSLAPSTTPTASVAQTSGGRVVNMTVNVDQKFELNQAALLEVLGEYKDELMSILFKAARDSSILATK